MDDPEIELLSRSRNLDVSSDPPPLKWDIPEIERLGKVEGRLPIAKSIWKISPSIGGTYFKALLNKCVWFYVFLSCLKAFQRGS